MKKIIFSVFLTAVISTAIGCGTKAAEDIISSNTVPRISATLSTTVVGTTTSSPIPIKVTFGEAIDTATFTLGDLQVTNGSAGNLQTVTAGTEYSFDVTPSSSNTTVIILLAADKVNSALSSILKNGSSTLSVAYQSTNLTVGMSTSAYTTNVSPFNVVVTFSDAVADFTSGDVTVGNGFITGISGTGTTYTLQVTPSAQGNVTLDIPAGRATKSSDGVTTNLVATQLVVAYDSVKPVATLTSTASDPTPTSPIPVRLTFSETISSFALSNLSITNGTAGGLTQITAGLVYDFSITPTANGTVSVQVNGGITDLAGNTSLASALISRAYDNTQPTVTITSTATNPTNSPLIPITITFSESVTGFSNSGITVTNGSKSSFAGSGTTYTLNVAPSADGTVTVAVGAGVAQDSAGNSNQAATNFTIISDRTVPTSTLTTTAASSTNISPIPVTLTFGEAVTGFTALNYLSSVTIGNGTASSYVKVSDSVYTFQVTPSSTSCNVTVDVASNAGTDAAGNTNTAATQLAVSYDSVQPTTTLSTAESTPSKNATFTVTITFSKSVTGFDNSDVTVTNGTSSLSGSGAVYTATITPAADGDVTVKVNANQAVDSHGNNNQGSNTITVRSDRTRPSVTITSSASNPTSTSPIPVTVSFSEAVTGFTASDLVVTNGTAYIASELNGVYTVNIIPASASSSVTVNLAANMAQDLASNLNTSASQYSVTYDGSTGSPTGLSYSTVVNSWVKDVAIANNTPTYSGGFATTWTSSVDFSTAGLTLNPSTGVISGTPTITTPGPILITITATNASGSTQTQILIYISASAGPTSGATITGTMTLPASVTNKVYSVTVNTGGAVVTGTFGFVTGNSFVYTIENVPAGSYNLTAGIAMDNGLHPPLIGDYALLDNSLSLNISGTGTFTENRTLMVIPAPIPPEMIGNGDFSFNIANWWGLQFGAVFTGDQFTLPDTYTNRGTNDWDLMIYQKGTLNLTKGVIYQISFDAKSTVSEDIEINVGEDGIDRNGDSNIYTSWAWKRFTLTSSMQTYSHTFTMDSTYNDPAANFSIQLGGTTGTITIDNVSMKPVP